MRGSRVFVAIVLGVLLAMGGTAVALAGPNGSDRPLQASATGYGYGPGPEYPGSLDCSDYAAGETTFAFLEGSMTHLGHVHVQMRYCTFYPQLGEFHTDTGVIDIVAAGGDVLHGSYRTWLVGAGDIGDPIIAGIDVSFDGTGGTGRFAGASGAAVGEVAFTMLGFDVNVWPATRWVLEGSLSY